jgi:hypothetical protein
MTARLALPILLAALTVPSLALAQTRTLVVPDGAPVVVPPRGQAMPPAAQQAVRTVRRRLAGDAIPLGPDAADPGLLPLAAAAALAAILPGSGGSSGPVRTR